MASSEADKRLIRQRIAKDKRKRMAIQRAKEVAQQAKDELKRTASEHPWATYICASGRPARSVYRSESGLLWFATTFEDTEGVKHFDIRARRIIRLTLVPDDEWDSIVDDIIERLTIPF